MIQESQRVATNANQLAKSGKYGDLQRRIVFLLLALVVYGIARAVRRPLSRDNVVFIFLPFVAAAVGFADARLVSMIFLLELQALAVAMVRRFVVKS